MGSGEGSVGFVDRDGAVVGGVHPRSPEGTVERADIADAAPGEPKAGGDADEDGQTDAGDAPEGGPDGDWLGREEFPDGADKEDEEPPHTPPARAWPLNQEAPVLIVDGAPAALAILRRLLKKAGIENPVHAAGDGVTAIDYLR